MGGPPLEPSLATMGNGERLNLVFDIVLQSSNRTLCRSKCHGQLFAIDHIFTDVRTPMTVLEGILCKGTNGASIAWDSRTQWIVHLHQHTSGLLRIVEACSGMGIMGKGYEMTGAQTMRYVDNNEKYCQWLRDHGPTPVVQGDICDSATIYAISKTVQTSHTLSGGFSRQPFSSLGDQKQEADPRSASFWGMLHAGHLLQSLAIILECTKEAASSDYVQEGLSQFAKQTGYKVAQRVLDLHTVWPAKRTRWWAIVTHPSIAVDEILPLPCLEFQPGIMHLTPTPMPMSQEQFDQIELDIHELTTFYEDKRGIKRNMVDFCKHLPTATHNWGSQTTACHCGCREAGFTMSRLQEKGLYGQLIQTNKIFQVGGHQVPGARHLHPQEVAMLNGLFPTFVQPSKHHLRLELSGVGQMASPIQSLWVLAQIQTHAHEVGLFPQVPEPAEMLANLCKALIHERNSIWSHKTIYMQNFEGALNALHPKIDFEAAQDTIGLTQDILAAVEAHEQTEVLTGELASQDPYQDEVSSGTDTPNLAEVLLTAYDPPSSPEEPTEIQASPNPAHENTEVPESPHDKFDSKSDLITSDLCDVHAESFGNDDDSIKLNNTSDLLSDEHAPVTDWCKHENVDTCHSDDPNRKRKHDQIDVVPLEVQFDIGAVPGFATGVSPKISHAHAQDQEAHHDVPVESHDSLSSADTDVSARVVSNPSGVFVVIAGEPIHTVQIHPECTVGQLAVATDKLQQMPEPIKITSAVGTQLPLSSSIPPGSFVRLQPVDQASKWKCRGPNCESQIPTLVNQERATLLWQQEGWIATDEMTYYMNMIQSKHPEVQCHLVDLTPELDYHVILTDILLRVANQMHIDGTPSTAMAILYHHHWFPVFIQVSDQVTITAPHEEAKLLQALMEKAVGPISNVQFVPEVLPHSFEADCGFQTLGWLISKILGDDTTVAWSDDQACQWRGLFHRHRSTQELTT